MCKIKEQELRGDTRDGQLVFQAEKKQKKKAQNKHPAGLQAQAPV
jgi:hypothetical protein